MTEHDLDHRVALVTGSTSGIGKTTAVRLARRGAHVIVVGRDTRRGEEVVGTIRAAIGKADFLRSDFRDANAARDLADQALQIGGGTVDILVNNAGGATLNSTADTTEEEWDTMINSNLKAHYFLVGQLAPRMAEKSRGAIVNVLSNAAHMGIPGMSVYGASKAALGLLTKSWAAEYGPAGVRVNAVSPGPTRTPAVEFMGDMLDQIAAQAPLGYIARPEQIADAIGYLVSDKATFITGTTLHVDGGRTAV